MKLAHFFAAQQIANSSSSTIAYLPSVSVRNLNPAWAGFQIPSFSYLRTKLMPSSLDASVMSRVFWSGLKNANVFFNIFTR
jgi:hypothetical protein